MPRSRRNLLKGVGMNRTQKLALIGILLQFVGVYIGAHTGVYSFVSFTMDFLACFQIALLAFEKEINK